MAEARSWANAPRASKRSTTTQCVLTAIGSEAVTEAQQHFFFYSTVDSIFLLYAVLL